MAKKEQVDTSLVGKAIEQMTPAELEEMAAQLQARQKSLRAQMEKEQFNNIAGAAREAAQVLGWTKLPKLVLTVTEAGDSYEVNYAGYQVKTTNSSGGRAKSDVSNGDITIKKIGTAMGGIDSFRDKDGKEYKSLKELVMALKQSDGKREAERCYDISKKGIAASDIVINYHADEVTLVFNNGTEKLVKDAVDEMKAARSAA